MKRPAVHGLMWFVLFALVGGVLFLLIGTHTRSKQADLAESTGITAADNSPGEQSGAGMSAYQSPHGSAERLCGRTVVLTFFVTQPVATVKHSLTQQMIKTDTSRWDEAQKADAKSKIASALDWLTEQAANYPHRDASCAAPTFSWASDDLNIDITLPGGIPESFDYATVQQTILAVNPEKLRRKYEAENVAAYFLYNRNSHPSAWGKEVWAADLWYEAAHVFTSEDEWVVPDGVYAHELLHLYGAPDLYYDPSGQIGAGDGAESNSVVPVSWAKKHCPREAFNEDIHSQDVMCVSGMNLRAMEAKLSDIDAYYVGLADDKASLQAIVHGASTGSLKGLGFGDSLHITVQNGVGYDPLRRRFAAVRLQDGKWIEE